MSWISTFMQGGKATSLPKKRNSMRTVEDLYDAKSLDQDDYVELKGNLLDGDFVAYRDLLAKLIAEPHPADQSVLEALYIKAQQLAHYKEQMQQGGDGDDDDDDEYDDDDDEDDEDDPADVAKLQTIVNAANTANTAKASGSQHAQVPVQGGGGRFASAYGPEYSPRYRNRSSWR